MIKRTVLLSIAIILTIAAFSQQLIEVYNTSASWDKVQSIEVDASFCKVDINQSASGASFTGKLSAQEKNDAYKIEASETAGVVKIAVKTPASGYISHAGEIVLNVPANIPVVVNNTSGYLTAKNMDAINLTGSTTSGKIIVEASKGVLKLRSKSGTIKVDGFEGDCDTGSKTGTQFVSNFSGTLVCNGDKGEIQIKDAKGNIKSEGIEGDQEHLNLEGTIRLKTGSGNLKLSEAKGVVNLFGLSGIVNLFHIEGEMNLRTTKGDIIGARIRFTEASSITTTEGKIKLRLENRPEDLTFESISESAYIQIFGKSKKKKLKVGKGPIVIMTETRTGAQLIY